MLAAQVNVEALPEGPKNPYGNGFVPVETDLTTESQAQRVCDPSTGRMWKIRNPNSLHPVTGAPAQHIHSGESATHHLTLTVVLASGLSFSASLQATPLSL